MGSASSQMAPPEPVPEDVSQHHLTRTTTTRLPHKRRLYEIDSEHNARTTSLKRSKKDSKNSVRKNTPAIEREGDTRYDQGIVKQDNTVELGKTSTQKKKDFHSTKHMDERKVLRSKPSSDTLPTEENSKPTQNMNVDHAIEMNPDHDKAERVDILKLKSRKRQSRGQSGSRSGATNTTEDTFTDLPAELEQYRGLSSSGKSSAPSDEAGNGELVSSPPAETRMDPGDVKKDNDRPDLAAKKLSSATPSDMVHDGVQSYSHVNLPGPNYTKHAAKRSAKQHDDSMVSGPFTAVEKEIVQSAFSQVMRTLNITEEELKLGITKWRTDARAMELRDLLDVMLPTRHTTSVRKFCQRRYHTYSRGPWELDEDQLLRKAYTINKDQWAKIAVHVGRSPDDCRDRWRDVLSRNGAQQGPWTLEEEDELINIVYALCEEAQVEDISSISWSVVSSRLDHRRNPKQCRTKYALLKDRITAGRQEVSLQSESKRYKEAKRQLSKFGNGDIYDVLEEIANTTDDRQQVFADPTTFWAVCAMKHPHSKFSSALRRVAFAEELVKYPRLADDTITEAASQMASQMLEQVHGDSSALLRSYEGSKKKKQEKSNLTLDSSAGNQKIDSSAERVAGSDVSDEDQ